MWFDFESLPSSPLLQLPSSHHQSSVNSYFCFSVPFLLVPFCKFLLLTLCVLVPLLPMTSFFSSSTIPFFWSSVHNRPDSGLSPAPQPQLSENNWMLQHHCKIWPTQYIYIYICIYFYMYTIFVSTHKVVVSSLIRRTGRYSLPFPSLFQF